MAFSFEPLLAFSAGHVMAVLAGPEQHYWTMSLLPADFIHRDCKQICAIILTLLWSPSPGLLSDDPFQKVLRLSNPLCQGYCFPANRCALRIFF